MPVKQRKILKFENYGLKKEFLAKDKEYSHFMQKSFESLRSESDKRADSFNLKVPELLSFVEEKRNSKKVIHEQIRKKTRLVAEVRKGHKKMAASVSLPALEAQVFKHDLSTDTFKSIDDFEKL